MRRFLRRFIVTVILNASALLLQAAPPQVSSLYPAGGQQGQTVVVTSAGSFSAWPVQGWADQPGIAVECGKDKGQFTLTISPDTPAGVALLRLFDKEGACAPRPLVIGTLPEVMEAEPNDDPRKPQVLSSSVTVVNGQLAKSGDVDTYAVQLSKGQTLVAAIDANQPLGSPMDAVLQIVSPQGFVLAQNDDERGLDPLLVFTATADGQYLVRTFAFPATPDSSIRFAGGVDFVYRLTITTGGFLDATLPLSLRQGATNALNLEGWNIPADASSIGMVASEGIASLRVGRPGLAGMLTLPVERHAAVLEAESADRAKPQAVEIPATITGRIRVPGETDTYEVTLKKGTRLAVRVESRALGYPLDPHLSVLDASGTALSFLDDTRGSRDAELTFVVPADGQYRVAVRDMHRHGGRRFVYRLRMAPAEPDFSLALAADSFVFKQGSTLEIPITIDRANGFAAEIAIFTEGLPEGIAAAPIKSEGKGGTAKQVKLVLTSNAGSYSGPIRIAGKSTDESGRVRTAAAPLANLNASIEAIWLTVMESK